VPDNGQGAMMMPEQLTSDDRQYLLRLARQSITAGVQGRPLPEIDLDSLSPMLRRPGASFVTLTKFGNLRGCIGTLEAYQSLAEDVREHALAAAMDDFRFPSVEISEVSDLKIEISCLTSPQVLEYSDRDDLLNKLRPGIDGVMLRDGFRRATFLPQVWEKISDPAMFLSYLCEKMGAEFNLWQRKKLDVSIYQVEEFAEEE